MDEKFYQIFKETIDDYGRAICDNCNLLNSLLADYAEGKLYKERRLLIWILVTGCHKTFTFEQDFEDWKQEWIVKLNADEFIDKKSAEKMLDVIFAILFGELFYINRGFKLLEKNNRNEAENCFNKALEHKPTSSDAFRGKGIIAFDNGDFDYSIECFSKSIKYSPVPSDSIKELLANSYENRGDIYREKGSMELAISDYEQSIEIYDKVIAINPDNIKYYEKRAEVYQKKGDYSLAINSYSIILEKDNTYINGYEKRAELLFRQKNYDSALKDCNSILAIEPKKSAAFYHCALIYMEMDNFQKARENIELAKKYNSITDLNNKIANALEKINTKESAYYERIGDDYLSQNNFTEALSAFSSAIKITPNNSKLYCKRGHIYNEEGNIMLAKDDFQSVLKCSTVQDEKYVAKGFLELIDENYNRAIDNFLEAIKKNDDWQNCLKTSLVSAYTLGGIVAFEKNDFDTAIVYISNAVKTDSKNNEYLNRLLAKLYGCKGKLLMANNDYSDAITHFSNAKQSDMTVGESFDADLVQAYYKKAIELETGKYYKEVIDCLTQALQLEENNRNRAENCFNKALEHKPTSSDAFRGKGIIAFDNEDFDYSIECFSKSIKYSPVPSDSIKELLANSYENRGDIYREKGTMELAIFDYKQSIELFHLSETLEKLADCYHEINKPDEELAVYGKAIDLYPDNIKYYEKRGKLFFIEKNYDSALKDCNAILAIEPKNSAAFYNRTLIYIEMNNFQKARENIELANKYNSITDLNNKIANALEKINTKESAYYERIGDDYLSQNNFTKAICAFSSAIKITPDNSKLYFKRGHIYNEEGNIMLAKDDFQSALKCSTVQDEQYIAAKGFLELMNKNYNLAIDNFIEVIKINADWQSCLKPSLVSAYTMGGIVAFEKNDFDTAIVYISNAVKTDSKNNEYLNRLLAKIYGCKGKLLMANNDYSDAITHFSNAKQSDMTVGESFNADLVQAYCKKAIGIDKGKYYNEVIDCLTQALQLDFTISNSVSQLLSDAYRLRAYRHHTDKNYKLAVSDYDHALKYLPLEIRNKKDGLLDDRSRALAALKKHNK
jgi:tetratricopeptide (TPR) repeat protein